MTAGDPREVWLLMSDLVLYNERRREVAEALGIDPPNATTVVGDLEKMGLLRRRPHPTDGRAKLVEATRKGKALAKRADELLATPPAAFDDLSADDLETLRRILSEVAAKT